MSDIITPDGLAAALADKYKKYTDEFKEEVFDGIQEIGKETAKEVKDNSPVYAGSSKAYKEKRKPGTYKKSWTYKVEKERGTITVTVHNRNYRLTHLLENGHLTRLGTGRKYYNEKGRKYSRPFTHIAPAEKHTEEKVDKLLEGL